MHSAALAAATLTCCSPVCLPCRKHSLSKLTSKQLKSVPQLAYFKRQWGKAFPNLGMCMGTNPCGMVRCGCLHYRRCYGRCWLPDHMRPLHAAVGGYLSARHAAMESCSVAATLRPMLAAGLLGWLNSCPLCWSPAEHFHWTGECESVDEL
jgi:hypothetical protein